MDCFLRYPFLSLYNTLIDGAIYDPASAQSALITVNPKSVSIKHLGAADKIYDTTDSTVITGTSCVEGKLDKNTLEITMGQSHSENSKAGESKIVKFSNFALSGAPEVVQNYSLASEPQDARANITKKSVTITGIEVNNKTYDGNKDAVIKTPGNEKINGNLDGTNLTVAVDTASFNDKFAGISKMVTLGGFGLDGTAASN